MKKIILLISLFLLCGCVNIVSDTVYKVGEVSRVEYLQGNFSASSKTILIFTDNTSVVLCGLRSFTIKNVTVMKRTLSTGAKYFYIKGE